MFRWGLLAGLLLVGEASALPAAAAQPELEQRSATDIEALRARAQRGDPGDQYELGLALMARNDEPSLVEARDWHRRATAAGNVEAQNALAGLLLSGSGGPPDEAEGRRLLLDAASRGSAGANFTLSMAHGNGVMGFPRDLRRSFSYMAAAAEADTRDGVLKWRFGMMHLRGIGTPRNEREAYRWVSMGAELGSIDGMISRAVMLATGEGVTENDAEARIWYQRAAESGKRGYQHALRGLGGMMLHGEGGPVDLERGFAYLFIARDMGDENAEILLSQFSPQLTPQMRERAEIVGREWRARHAPGRAR